MRTRLSAVGVLLLAGMIATWLPAAAAADGPGLTIQRVDASVFPSVDVYASAASPQGAPISGLDAGAFALVEDGAPVQPLKVQAIAYDDPTVSALVIDVNGTMSDGQKLDRTRDAATAYIDALGPADRATVVSFGSRVTVVQEYSADKAALKSAMDSLAPRGDRLLYDALAQTARRQDQQPEASKPIILVTDGSDARSAESVDAGIVAATAGGVQVFAIGLGPNVDRDTLAKIAAATGGQAIFVPDPGDLKATFLGIAEQLRRGYLLSYVSSLSPDSRPHSLTLALTSAGQRISAQAPFTIPKPAVPLPINAPATSQPVPTVAPTAVVIATPATAASVVTTTTTSTENGPNWLLVGIVGLIIATGIAALVLGIMFLPRRHMALAAAPSSAPSLHDDGTDATDLVGALDAEATVLGRNGPEPSMAQLRIPQAAGDRNVDLVGSECIIGRDDKATVSLRDARASRQHARIVRDQGQFWIEDLRSLNGTRVNEELLTQRRKLVSQDRITVGDTTLTFVVSSTGGDRSYTGGTR